MNYTSTSCYFIKKLWFYNFMHKICEWPSHALAAFLSRYRGVHVLCIVGNGQKINSDRWTAFQSLTSSGRSKTKCYICFIHVPPYIFSNQQHLYKSLLGQKQLLPLFLFGNKLVQHEASLIPCYLFSRV